MSHPELLAGELAYWISRRRWSGLAGRKPGISLYDFAAITEGRARVAYIFLRVEAGDKRRLLALPFALMARGRSSRGAVSVRCRDGTLSLEEGEFSPAFASHVLKAISQGSSFRTHLGNRIRYIRISRVRGREVLDIKTLGGGDTTNAISMVKLKGHKIVLKGYRYPSPSNPEPGMLNALVKQGFANVTPLVARAIYTSGTKPMDLTLITEFVENRGDMRAPLRSSLLKSLRAGELGSIGGQVACSARMGSTVAEMHAKLASWPERGFGSLPVREADIEGWEGRISSLLRSVQRILKSLSPHETKGCPIPSDVLTHWSRDLVGNMGRIDLRGHLDLLEGTKKIRTHQDLHLAQLIYTGGSGGQCNFLVLDFEGDPQRDPRGRSSRDTPLRDVAGMKRSFGYVKHEAIAEFMSHPRAKLEGALKIGDEWEERMSEGLITGYVKRGRELGFDALGHLMADCDLFKKALFPWTLEKAALELRYETLYRPARLYIPLEGLHKLFSIITGDL
jgi:predicted trehalose synthase